MASKTQTTALTIHKPERLALAPDAQYAVYDVNARARLPRAGVFSGRVNLGIALRILSCAS